MLTRPHGTGRPDLAELRRRFAARQATVAVVGLGYVGLPLARLVASAGFTVVGFDTNEAKVAALRSGAGSEAPAAGAGVFRATDEPEELGAADVVVICVPTPLSPNREPDLGHVVQAAECVGAWAGRAGLVSLESTSYPGTTTDVVRPILERGGLRSGTDFFLAYSPERRDPGNLSVDDADIPKVVGGDGEDALALASLFYGQFHRQVVPVSTPNAAEAVKLTENIFRAVNVALVNELKVVFDQMGIDIWEVVEAAATKPFGFMPFFPGPGLGGHCIPVDPFYLTWKAREHGLVTRFIELAGEMNLAMPAYVVGRLAEAMNDRLGMALRGARVLLLGVAYKKNIADVRGSPALSILGLLRARGAAVSFHDPHVKALDGEHGCAPPLASVQIAGEEVRRWDVAVICTDHDAVDYAAVVSCCKLVVDTRNVCRRQGLAVTNVVMA